jgi:hypothetical protein
MRMGSDPFDLKARVVRKLQGRQVLVPVLLLL